MNELDLPPRRPLPARTRERALRSVLDGIDAPPRRRIAPLAAAAVVVVVLGAATAVALSRPQAPGEPQLPPRPAVASSTVAPAPVEPDLPPPVPGGDTPAQNTGTGYVDPLVRCKAAVTSSGRAGEYPAVDGWTVSDHMDTRYGVDQFLAIDDAFLCYASPTTVSVSRTAGVPVSGVEVVRVGPGLFGVLNPGGASVSWAIGARSNEPSTAAVQAVELDGGAAPTDALLSVVAAGSTGPAHVEPLPGAAPDPIVVTDRPLPPRDSTTVDGAALDDCVGPTPWDPSYPDIPRMVTGDTELELWQPLARFDLPDGGFAISAMIGQEYAGLCVRTDDRRYWWSRQFLSAELPATSSIFLSGGGLGVGLFGLSEAVVRVELTTADGRDVPCEIRSRLALCAGDADGPLTLTLFDSAGVPVQQQVSLEDI